MRYALSVRYLVIGVLTSVLLVMGSACSGRIVSGADPGRQGAPEANGSDLPKPSALRQVSYDPAKLVCNGADYLQVGSFPWLNVSQVDTSVAFSPDWRPGSTSPSVLAYACYAFDMTGYDRAPQIIFSWDQTGDEGTAWIGLADFARDCWSWQPLPLSNVLSLDLADYIDPVTHNMLVLPLFTGTSHWILNQIHVGDLATLTGHVWQDEGVTPLYDAEVTVSGPAEYSARVDYEGKWTLQGVVPGDYTVSAHLVGWEITPASREVSASGLDLTVDDFQGTPLPTHAASGTVVSTPGDQPMRGVELVVTPQGSPYGSVSSWTDDTGLWTIELPDGDFDVAPKQGGWGFTPTSRQFTVAGADVVVDNFTGEKLPGYTVDGYVFQAGSLIPMEGVQVNVDSEELGLYFTASTDASGYWSIPDVPDGDYASIAILVGWHFSPSGQTITVAGAAHRAEPYIGTAIDKCTLVGYVYKDDGVTPLRGITMMLSGDEGWYYVTTNSAGRYEFADIYAGHYGIVPQDVHYLFAPAERQIYVTDDMTVQPFLATTLPTVEVDGYVYLPDGVTGVPDVKITVYAYFPVGTSFETTTDDTGHWVAQDIPPSFYTVLPEKQGYTFTPESAAIQVEDVNLSVEDFLGGPLPSYVMDGFVYEVNGTTPVPGVEILVQGWNYYYEAITDASGHWQLDEVFEDMYTVAPMLAPWQFAPSEQNITVAGANVTLAPFLGVQLPAWKVDGYIYEADSTTPVPDIEVWFYGGTLGYRCKTDENGYYEIVLPNGAWEAAPTASCWTFDPVSQLFTMNGAAQTLEPFYATASG